MAWVASHDVSPEVGENDTGSVALLLPDKCQLSGSVDDVKPGEERLADRGKVA